MTQEQKDSINELRELARATQAYCEQDSRSERRKLAMRNGAVMAINHAQKAFGDEDESSTV